MNFSVHDFSVHNLANAINSAENCSVSFTKEILNKILYFVQCGLLAEIDKPDVLRYHL